MSQLFDELLDGLKERAEFLKHDEKQRDEVCELLDELDEVFRRGEGFPLPPEMLFLMPLVKAILHGHSHWMFECGRQYEIHNSLPTDFSGIFDNEEENDDRLDPA